MYLKLDEEFYVENPFLAHLQRLGWEVFRQNKDNPEDVKKIIKFTEKFEPKYGESVKFRDSFKEVILEEVLRESIKKINSWIEDDQINEVIRKITNPQSNILLEINKEIHEILLGNLTVSENRKNREKSPTVKLIDFKNPHNNTFIAISQFKVNIPGTEKHIIPDIVLFVNGIPLVVVECKSPSINDPLGEALEQLKRYSNRRGEKEGNEKLFWYNLFMVATFRQKAVYGTITAEEEHFVEWKDPYPYSLSDISPEGSITSQELLIQGMLSKENLLDILHNFTILKDEVGKGFIKVVPRYQQFRAVKKMIKRIKEGKTPEERGGIVWHTQGSGKSLTMMYLVRACYHDPELRGYKIVFITDRKDLQKQLNETSKSVGFTVNLAQNIEHLKSLLRTNTPDLVMGMVHKFQERELKKAFPVLNTSEKILVMIDEAHRTQYKLLGANLRKSLPNSVKIAFTGTPIEKTELTFGDYIDKYTIKQAVEDGVTVEIVYEGRAHDAEIINEEELDKKFLDVFHLADSEDKKILNKYTWKAYLEHEGVIKHKAKDMIDHYVKHVFPNRFKAQVVAVSRLAAIRYKHALEEALKEKIAQLEKENFPQEDLELLKRLKIEVVISGSPNDPPEWKNYTDPEKHERIIKSFKLPFDRTDESGINGDVGIIVVQSMLLTGFDAPIEQVLYLDNVIKGHNLLQAIARVNRVYKGKSCGFVVDYVGVIKHLKEALSIYAQEDIEEIEKVVKNKAKSLDELRFVAKEIDNFFEKQGVENWRENIEECIDLLADEEIRNEFVSLVRRFNRAMDAVLPDPQALNYTGDLKILNFIKQVARNRYRDEKLSPRDASRKIREIVEEYLISKGIDPKIPPTPLFDEAFIQEINTEKTLKAKAKTLEYAIVEYVTKHYEEDPELYERFSERLRRILQEYKDNWELLAKELKKLREDLIKGREGEEIFGLDPKKEMPFFGILKMNIFGKKQLSELKDEDINILVKLTEDIVEVVKREVNMVDFWESNTKQKRLKSYIINNILLPRNKDYPMILYKRNEIAQQILELAYNIYGKSHG